VKIQAFSIIAKRCDFKLMNTVKRFKKRIDEIALEMIDQTKKCEANIFERTKRASFFETASFDETKSLLLQAN